MDPKTSQTPARGAASVSGTDAATTKSGGFIEGLDEILSTSKSRTAGGTKIRANIGYTLVAEGVRKLIGTSIPDQQKFILQVMDKALTKEKPVITEVDLNALIVKAHAEGRLKTKQDPWHIFRYYRTSLKSAGALREIVMKPETPVAQAA